jgi:hypothetical protein
MEYKLGNSQEKDIALNHLSCQNWTVKLLPTILSTLISKKHLVVSTPY